MDGTTWIEAAALVAGLASAATGGIFFAFSGFIMQALGRIAPAAGMGAMQTINVTVLNPAVMLLLFGPGIVGIGLTWAVWDGPGRWAAFAGTALYVLGCIAVTIGGNVPLNERLKAADPDSADGRALWTGYLRVWTRWNTVRTAACFAAATAFWMVS